MGDPLNIEWILIEGEPLDAPRQHGFYRSLCGYVGGESLLASADTSAFRSVGPG